MFDFLRKKKRGKSPRRNYQAAQQIARLGDFTASNLSANAELQTTLTILRERSRNLYRNSPYFRRWVAQCQTNIVGAAGFTLQVRAKNTNGGMDRRGNEAVEQKWKEWCKTCTADGMMSFQNASKMPVRSWARDGEAFAEIVYGSRFTHGMALHFFEADMVDETHNETRNNRTGNEIRMGVEIDRFERPVAYHILEDHPGDTYWSSGAVRRRRRVSADRIIHVFIKDRPGQTRGEPPAVATMVSSKMLDGYREAEVTGRRLAASKMGFFTRDKGGSGDVGSLADSVNQDSGELEMDVHPGKLSSLPEGMSFESFDMKGFSTDYEQFERQMIRSIAMGLNTSYVSVSGDLTQVSYSSIRSGELSDRDVWREMQRFFIERFAEKVYEKWIDNAFQFTDIKLPYVRLDKFHEASRFQARGWGWVDPQKEIAAAKDAIDNNMTSLTSVVNEQGRDLEDVLKEKAAEQQLAETLGMTLDNSSQSGQNAPNDGE